jgi:uncharacterized damage-inducible protein DinB
VLSRDLGAFFKSILGTLNHLLLADRLWMGRFTGVAYPATRLDEILYADFAQLRAERSMTDQALTDYLDGLSDADLDKPLHYTSLLSPEPRTLRLGDALLHVFHHQTHHRGQVTTLLSQLGVDFGETDLLFIPGVVQRG